MDISGLRVFTTYFATALHHSLTLSWLMFSSLCSSLKRRNTGSWTLVLERWVCTHRTEAVSQLLVLRSHLNLSTCWLWHNCSSSVELAEPCLPHQITTILPDPAPMELMEHVGCLSCSRGRGLLLTSKCQACFCLLLIMFSLREPDYWRWSRPIGQLCLTLQGWMHQTCLCWDGHVS